MFLVCEFFLRNLTVTTALTDRLMIFCTSIDCCLDFVFVGVACIVIHSDVALRKQIPKITRPLCVTDRTCGGNNGACPIES